MLRKSIDAKRPVATSELSAGALASVAPFRRIALFLTVATICIVTLLCSRGDIVTVESCLAWAAASRPSNGVELALTTFGANFSRHVCSFWDGVSLTGQAEIRNARKIELFAFNVV